MEGTSNHTRQEIFTESKDSHLRLDLVLTEGGQNDQVVSDEQREIFDYFSILTGLLVGMMGITCNVINLMIFVRLGRKDCVSVCLLFLAISDNASLMVGVSGSIIYILDRLTSQAGIFFRIDLMAVSFQLAFTSNLFYDISTFTTALVSIERCLCVAMPFKFKNFMTYHRAVIALVIIYLSVVLLYTPHYLTSGLRPTWDPRTNTTRIVLWLAPNREYIEDILVVLVNIILAPFGVLVVLICTTIMVVGMQKSTKFQQGDRTDYKPEVRSSNISEYFASDNGSRENNSAWRCEHDANKTPEKILPDFKRNVQDSSRSKDQRNFTRNRRVIKMVSVLATICLVCNFCRLIIFLTLTLNPELQITGQNKNLTYIVAHISFFFKILNCSLNLFVYLRFNTAYRKTFHQIFGIKTSN